MSSVLDSPPTLVPIETHSLALYTHGPASASPPPTSTPAVVFLPGIASSRFAWSAVVRLLPSSIRSYTYDRSGYSNSESSPAPPTAENHALDLYHLIQNSPAPDTLWKRPLILVGHSWAGVMIKELILLCHKRSLTRGETKIPKVAGIVLVDANHETALDVLDPNDPALEAMSSGLTDPYDAKGITGEHKLTAPEWTALRADEATPSFAAQAEKEDREYVPSFATLKSHSSVGKKGQALFHPEQPPVFVIGGMRSRDWGRVYEAGLQRGNGTEEERNRVQELIATADEKSAGLMRRHAEELSKKGKLVFAKESGHFVQLTEPGIVVEGVKWVFHELEVGYS